MHSLTKLYMVESWFAFTAGGALLLLALALPASVTTQRPIYRWAARILMVVVLVSLVGWGVTNLWMRHLPR